MSNYVDRLISSALGQYEYEYMEPIMSIKPSHSSHAGITYQRLDEQKSEIRKHIAKTTKRLQPSPWPLF